MKGGDCMKGYITPYGYLGWMPIYKRYILFSTEAEYFEAYKEQEIV